MTPKERAAMQQALEALDTAYGLAESDWTEQKYNKAITALREALAEPDMNLNCKSVQARLATLWGYVKAEQAEQEPDYFGLTHDHTWLSIDKKQYDKLKPEGRMACYAAPVRTKDLTDDEMEELCRKYARFELIREAIASDRENNK